MDSSGFPEYQPLRGAFFFAPTTGIMAAHEPPAKDPATPQPSPWSNKYRGATVEDLDPPPALSVHPSTPLGSALMTAFERDYTHLTVLDPETKALLGYLSIPHLKHLLQTKEVKENDPVEKAMVKFQRKGGAKYRVISPETPLEELEGFFEGGHTGRKEEFAVVTDVGRRFVLGVATRGDLEEFCRRRPG